MVHGIHVVAGCDSRGRKYAYVTAGRGGLEGGLRGVLAEVDRERILECMSEWSGYLRMCRRGYELP